MASDAVEAGENLGGDGRRRWNGVCGSWLLVATGSSELALAFAFGWWMMGFTVDADG